MAARVPSIPSVAPSAETTSAPDHSADGELLDSKYALRAAVLRERDRKPAEERARASATITAAMCLRDDFAASATVLLTLPFGSEWDTRALLAAALDRAKTVALPRVNRATRTLDVCAIARPAEDVAPGYRGIPEPCAHCAALDVASVDWVLVPGVAFDREGHRIGYGGGYYDRLLPLLRDDACRVAGAFELQWVESVPAAAHDVRVDAIVTEVRTVSFVR